MMQRLEYAITASMIGSPRIEPGVLISAEFSFEKDFIGFSGHFPGYPLLPAFVQIACASMLIRHATSLSTTPTVLEKAKFLLEIHPGDKIRIDCSRLQGSGEEKWRVSVHAGEALAAGFHLTLPQKGAPS